MRKFFLDLRDDYAAQRKAERARNEETYRRAFGVRSLGDFELKPLRSAQAEPEQKCPSYRLVAEPCAQGTRLKRYEPVAGTAEMVLVSVEILRS